MATLAKVETARPGRDTAGVISEEVEAVGRNVTHFTGRRGVRRVPYSVCRVRVRPGVRLGEKPHNVAFDQAASEPVAGLTALQTLRDKGQIQPDGRFD